MSDLTIFAMFSLIMANITDGCVSLFYWVFAIIFCILVTLSFYHGGTL